MHQMRESRRGLSTIFGQALVKMQPLLRKTSKADFAQRFSPQGIRLVRHRLRQQIQNIRVQAQQSREHIVRFGGSVHGLRKGQRLCRMSGGTPASITGGCANALVTEANSQTIFMPRRPGRRATSHIESPGSTSRGARTDGSGPRGFRDSTERVFLILIAPTPVQRGSTLIRRREVASEFT